MSEKRCYTVKELQAILGVSRPSVYELFKRDVFRSFIVGGEHIISKSSFDEWLDGGSQLSLPEVMTIEGTDHRIAETIVRNVATGFGTWSARLQSRIFIL